MFLMLGGREFQRRGAERLKALAPMVVRWAGGTVRLMDEADLSDREGVLMWRRSERYGGERLWMALKVWSRILKLMRDLTGSKLLQNRCDVIDGWDPGDDAGSRVLNQLEFVGELVGETKEKVVTIVQAGCDQSVDQDGSGVGSEGWTEMVDVA